MLDFVKEPIFFKFYLTTLLRGIMFMVCQSCLFACFLSMHRVTQKFPDESQLKLPC